uniref:Uncharacterized protein n=1 Tax=Pyramimonas obovata TaxID=1411642 RepID=A0A7S0R7X9_9CHLO|mmetsp:Transcript_27896/g.61034  ORF Transcript_27896/g.61034 Transcript_27896/m.61034 type:complete len:206 (+) Transcript_27896:867-1484(+)
MAATRAGHMAVARYLVRRGCANAHAKDVVHGRSALGWAAHQGNGELVAWCVSEGLATVGDLQRIEASRLCGPRSAANLANGQRSAGLPSDTCSAPEDSTGPPTQQPPSLLRLAVCAVVALRLPRDSLPLDLEDLCNEFESTIAQRISLHRMSLDVAVSRMSLSRVDGTGELSSQGLPSAAEQRRRASLADDRGGASNNDNDIILE